jgi:hypothetical protein
MNTLSHPDRWIGPPVINVVDMQGQSKPLGSVILVSVMPEEYHEALRTDRQGPLVTDFFLPLPNNFKPENYWAARPCVSYKLPAAPNGGRGLEGWSAISVYPCLVKSEAANTEKGVMGFHTEWFGALEEAIRLRSQWGSFANEGLSGVGLKVFMSADDITPAAIAEMQAEVEVAMRRVVESADALVATENPMMRQIISSRHRFAAGFLGLHRSWAAASAPSKPCPACRANMNALATHCAACGVDVRKYWADEVRQGYRTIEEVEAQDASVVEMVRRALARTGDIEPEPERKRRGPRVAKQDDIVKSDDALPLDPPVAPPPVAPTGPLAPLPTL